MSSKLRLLYFSRPNAIAEGGLLGVGYGYHRFNDWTASLQGIETRVSDSRAYAKLNLNREACISLIGRLQIKKKYPNMLNNFIVNRERHELQLHTNQVQVRS